MKSFYSESPVADSSVLDQFGGGEHAAYIGTRARVAVYDAPAAAPHVEDVGPAPAREYIESLSSRVFDLARQRGGEIPYTVIRELAENLLHAGFAEPVVSILDAGATIRFSDQGPGIPDKEKALRPGYTTASAAMKDVIRGVGSGLPIVSDFLSVVGGSLSIEDNLRGGAVITISQKVGSRASAQDAPTTPALHAPVSVPRPARADDSLQGTIGFTQGLPFEPPAEEIRLSTRQKHVLALVLETGVAGPSIVSRELGVGLSTAYRDLASLEELGLIEADGGKRTLTAKGADLLGRLMHPNAQS